jgi:hypothetical protein
MQQLLGDPLRLFLSDNDSHIALQTVLGCSRLAKDKIRCPLPSNE